MGRTSPFWGEGGKVWNRRLSVARRASTNVGFLIRQPSWHFVGPGPFRSAPSAGGDGCAAIGVHELIFDCRGQSIAESIERLQWFATDVIPLMDG
jgi:hypothetical protein